MTAIWTPSKELWTPKHPAFRRRVSEWCRMAAGAVSTCGGKANTKNGKVSTNANQTGGCGCVSGCTSSRYKSISWTGISITSGCLPETFGSYHMSSQFVSGTPNGYSHTFDNSSSSYATNSLVALPLITSLYASPNDTCGACSSSSGNNAGYAPATAAAVNGQIVVSSLSLLYPECTSSEALPNPMIFTNSSMTYPLVDGTYTNESTTMGTGGTATVTSVVPSVAISSLPSSITISGGPVTQVGGCCFAATAKSVATNGTFSLISTLACDTNSSDAIGLLYGSVTDNIFLGWGYGAAYTSGLSTIMIQTATQMYMLFFSYAQYYSSTLIGTYTALTPDILPSTLTVSL